MLLDAILAVTGLDPRLGVDKIVIKTEEEAPWFTSPRVDTMIRLSRADTMIRFSRADGRSDSIPL